MTGIYREVEPAPGKKAHAIDGFTCDECGKTISFEDRKKKKTWVGIHPGFCDWDGSPYAALDACSVKCFVEVLSKFIKEHPKYSEVEVNSLGIEFAKALIMEIQK